MAASDADRGVVRESITFRIFVNSIFRDFKAERNALQEGIGSRSSSVRPGRMPHARVWAAHGAVDVTCSVGHPIGVFCHTVLLLFAFHSSVVRHLPRDDRGRELLALQQATDRCEQGRR